MLLPDALRQIKNIFIKQYVFSSSFSSSGVTTASELAQGFGRFFTLHALPDTNTDH